MNSEILVYCCTRFVKRMMKELREEKIDPALFLSHTKLKILFLSDYLGKAQNSDEQQSIKDLLKEYNALISTMQHTLI